MIKFFLDIRRARLFSQKTGCKTDSNFSGGFTVVEALVSLTIIAILTGIVIFNIGSTRQNSALLKSAQQLSLDLRRAQTFALTSKDFKTFGIPCGWGVHFNGINSNSYVVFADLASSTDCSGRDFKRTDSTEDFETVYLESGVTFTSLSNNLTDVVFTPPDPTVTFTPNQATTSIITLTNRNSSIKVINVNRAGLISSP